MCDNEAVEWLLKGDIFNQYQEYCDILKINKPGLKEMTSTEGRGNNSFFKKQEWSLGLKSHY